MTNLTTVRKIITASFGTVEAPGPMTPIFIEGAPGTGKTQLVKDIAKDAGVGFVFIPASTMRPEDLTVPDVLSEGSTYDYKIFKNLPVIGNEDLPDRGVLVFDESSQADLDIQKFLGQVLPPNSAAGTHKMKPGWLIIATGNRREDKAGANKLLTHLLDRFILVEDVEPTLKEWTDYSLTASNRGDDDFNPLVMAFHQQSEGRYLHTFDGSQTQVRKTATFRGWSMASRFINSLGMGSKELPTIVRGIVGEAAAQQFYAFVQVANELPDIDEVLSSVEAASRFVVPKPLGHRWFMTSAIARKADWRNADAVIAALLRLCDNHEDMLVAGLLVAKDYGDRFSSSEAFGKQITAGVFDSLHDQLGL